METETQQPVEVAAPVKAKGVRNRPNHSSAPIDMSEEACVERYKQALVDGHLRPHTFLKRKPCKPDSEKYQNPGTPRAIGKAIVQKERKYLDWQSDWVLQRVIRNMAANGFIEEDMAKVLGIPRAMLNHQIHLHPHIEKAVLEGKAEATKAIVAKTFQTAMGGQEIVTIREEQRGKKKTRVVTRTELAPDPSQQRFWLTNRAPEDWKNGENAPPAYINLGIINPQIAEADLERIKRIAGAFAESGTKQIESVARDCDKSLQEYPDGTEP